MRSTTRTNRQVGGAPFYLTVAESQLDAFSLSASDMRSTTRTNGQVVGAPFYLTVAEGQLDALDFLFQTCAVPPEPMDR